MPINMRFHTTVVSCLLSSLSLTTRTAGISSGTHLPWLVFAYPCGQMRTTWLFAPAQYFWDSMSFVFNTKKRLQFHAFAMLDFSHTFSIFKGFTVRANTLALLDCSWFFTHVTCVQPSDTFRAKRCIGRAYIVDLITVIHAFLVRFQQLEKTQATLIFCFNIENVFLCWKSLNMVRSINEKSVKLTRTKELSVLYCDGQL